MISCTLIQAGGSPQSPHMDGKKDTGVGRGTVRADVALVWRSDDHAFLDSQDTLYAGGTRPELSCTTGLGDLACFGWVCGRLYGTPWHRGVSYGSDNDL